MLNLKLMKLLIIQLMILLIYFQMILKLSINQTGNKKLEILYNNLNSLLLLMNIRIQNYKLNSQDFKALNKNKIL